MSLVHVAFLGFQNEYYTPCSKAPDYGPTQGHKWVMGDEDKCVSCMWCGVIAWHTYRPGRRPPAVGLCAHGRATGRTAPGCPLCRCQGGVDHIWSTDRVANMAREEFCARCHATRTTQC